MSTLRLTRQDQKFFRALRVAVPEDAEHEPLDLPKAPVRAVAPFDSIEAEMCATDDAMVPFDKFHSVCQAIEASEKYADVLQGMYRQKSAELDVATTQLANCALTVAGFKTQGDKQVSEARESERAWKCGFWIAVCFGVAMTFVAVSGIGL